MSAERSAGLGRVQGEREPDRLIDLVHEPAQSGHPADGRDRRPTVRDADVREAPGGFEHSVQVHHRLAHPHEDAVVDRLDAAEMENLVEDLGGAQVACEAHPPGGAEGAGERAAGLARTRTPTAARRGSA